MSFFKKMMAKVGIGNIDFDTQFHTEAFIPGEFVEGVIVAKGGKIEQQVDKIYFQIMTEYRKPSPIDSDPNRTLTESIVIANILLGESFVLEPGESIEIPFNFMLPHETPISIGVNPIWIRTNMDIDNAVDPSDRDDIEVLAHPHTHAIFEALEELGFYVHKAENEYFPRHNYYLPFIQNFEFVPCKNSEYSHSVEELELVFYPDTNGVKIFMEFDRKARGFSGLLAEMMDMDESHHRYYFSTDELEEGTSAVANQFRGIFNGLLR